MKFTIANLTIQINRRTKPDLRPDLSNTSYDKVFCIGDHKTGDYEPRICSAQIGIPHGESTRRRSACP